MLHVISDFHLGSIILHALDLGTPKHNPIIPVDAHKHSLLPLGPRQVLRVYCVWSRLSCVLFITLALDLRTLKENLTSQRTLICPLFGTCWSTSHLQTLAMDKSCFTRVHCSTAAN